MARRKKEEGGGIPEWMCTYGDMMSLLLCFFIMLFAMSTITPIKWEALIRTMNMKLGYTGSSAAPSSSNKPSAALFSASEMSRRTAALTGGQPTDGPAGENPTLQNIRESGDRTKGGLIRFELGRAELGDQAEADLQALLQILTKSANKIRVEGYMSPAEEDAGIYSRGIYLAQARAVNVVNHLISLGLKEEFFEIGVSASSPNHAVLPKGTDSRLAGASAAVYLISGSSRPQNAP